MCIEGVCDEAAEFVVDAGGDAIGGHESGVHLHFLRGVAIFRFLVPGIFVLTSLGCGGVKLIGEVFDCESHFRGGIGRLDAAYSFIKSLLCKIRPGAYSVECKGDLAFINHCFGIWGSR